MGKVEINHLPVKFILLYSYHPLFSPSVHHLMKKSHESHEKYVKSHEKS